MVRQVSLRWRVAMRLLVCALLHGAGDALRATVCGWMQLWTRSEGRRQKQGGAVRPGRRVVPLLRRRPPPFRATKRSCESVFVWRAPAHG